MEENIEIWRDIPNYEDLYQVSTLGNVKSLNYNRSGKERLLKPRKTKNGYLIVSLFKDKKAKIFLVHRIVCLAFLKNDNNLPCVNHKDENKQNNRVDNLEFCSVLYNNTYNNAHIKRGEKRKGKPLYHKRVPIIQCTLDGVFIRDWDSATTASKELNISQGHITHCCKGVRNQCGGYKWVYKSEYYKPTNTQLELKFN